MHILKRIYDKLFVNYKRIKMEVESDIVPTIISINNKQNNIDYNIEKVNSELLTVVNKEKIFNSELLTLRETSKKKILLVGFYGAPNLGDELMLETLFQYLNKNKKIEITVMINDNEFYDIDEYPPVNIIHYPKTKYDFNYLASYFDCVVFGGGAIIDDIHYEKENSYKGDLGTILIKLSEKFITWNKEVITIGLSSISEFSNQKYINKLTEIIDKSLYFSVRDTNSYKTLQKYCKCNKKSIHVISDIIMANKKLEIIKDKSEKLTDIGIVWIPYEENNDKLKQLLKKLNKNYKIHLIPFYEYTNFDTNMYNKILNELNLDNVIVEKYQNSMIGITETYKKCNLIIAMRYHGVLLGNLLNIPTISICYDNHPHYYNKMKFLSEIFEDKNIIMISKLNPNTINENINKKFNEYKTKESKIEKLKQNSQNEIENIIEKLI